MYAHIIKSPKTINMPAPPTPNTVIRITATIAKMINMIAKLIIRSLLSKYFIILLANFAKAKRPCP